MYIKYIPTHLHLRRAYRLLATSLASEELGCSEKPGSPGAMSRKYERTQHHMCFRFLLPPLLY